MQNFDLGHVLPLTVTGTPIVRGPAHTAERRACNAHAQQHATLDAAGHATHSQQMPVRDALSAGRMIIVETFERGGYQRPAAPSKIRIDTS